MRRAFLAIWLLAAACTMHATPAVAPSPTAAAAATTTPVTAEHSVAPPEPATEVAPPPVIAPTTPVKVAEAHVILVTLDGVRWQDVFEGAERGRIRDARAFRGKVDSLTQREGLLPHTWELVAKSGVALGHGGKNCGVVRPRNTTHISLPGYFEIFTAKRTTCMSNVCPRVKSPTFLDAAAAAGMSTASIGSWEMLDMAATHYIGANAKVFVSAGTARWPGKRPIENAEHLEKVVREGEKAKPFPAPDGTYRPDRYTAAIALEYLRVYRPRVFHVGFGDMDEHGHRDDYVSYLLSLREADAFLGDLASTLESMNLLDSTTVIVTSDHGRASNMFKEHGPFYPDSGRTFVVAFGGGITKRGEACAQRPLWLTDIAPTIRALVDLPRDPSPDVVGVPIEEIVQR